MGSLFEYISRILARYLENDLFSSRMIFQELGNVVDLGVSVSKFRNLIDEESYHFRAQQSRYQPLCCGP